LTNLRWLKWAISRHFRQKGLKVHLASIRLGNVATDGEVEGTGWKMALEIKTPGDDITRGIGQLAEAQAYGYNQVALVTTSIQHEVTHGLKRVINWRAVASLILSRVVYAVNWYNVASVFVLIALDFRENVAGLGVLTGSLYMGLGLFQVPGGIMAAKYGPRRTGIYGTLIASSAALLTAFTTQFYQITVLRFIVGLGMAMVFAPGVTLIAKYFRNHAEGLSVGLFNAAFYVGGAFGLFGWAILAEIVGWRPSIVTSGILGILTGILMIFMVPKDNIREDFPIKLSDLRRILLNRWLLVLTLELFGITSGVTLVTTFMVFYLEDSLKITAALAGIVGGLSMFLAILASPIFGRIYDRTKNARRLLFLSGLGLSLGN